MAKIDEPILERLNQNIRELLAAGWNCGKIGATLGRQQSFGKYDGCTPTAIQELAVAICNDLNAKTKQARREAMEMIRQDFGTPAEIIRKYFQL